MAVPHVAGIAALIKQYNPSWDPSMIASAITTTSTKYDNLGELIMAEGYGINTLYPSTPFDYGAGIVNPNWARDPGLVLPSGMLLLVEEFRAREFNAYSPWLLYCTESKMIMKQDLQTTSGSCALCQTSTRAR